MDYETAHDSDYQEPAGDGLPDTPDECEIADIEVKLFLVERPDHPIETENVLAVGAFHTAYQYGYRMGFFDAVDTAIRQIDRNEIPFNLSQHKALANMIGCYQMVSRRINEPQVAVYAARSLGFRNPAVPEAEHNSAFAGLFRDLLDAINEACCSCGGSSGARRCGGTALRHAYRRLQANLAGTVSLGTALAVRNLQVRLDHATAILSELADDLPSGYLAGEAAALRSAWYFNGRKLEADGIRLEEAADTVEAWRALYDWLASDNPPETDDDVPPAVCDAAAVLRPVKAGKSCCCCTPASPVKAEGLPSGVRVVPPFVA